MKTHAMIALTAALLASPVVAAPIPGLYHVPVQSRPELEPYAGYEVDDAQLRVDRNGEARLTYHMPLHLVGKSTLKIDLRGTAPASGDAFTLDGDLGRASCDLSDQTAPRCEISYKMGRMGIDPAAVDSHLAATYTDPVEMEARKAVATIFRHEAIGILTGIEVEDCRQTD